MRKKRGGPLGSEKLVVLGVCDAGDVIDGQ